ncbi:putative capsular polysaccharide synthesis family protein [Thalassotalea piscium]|uniref:Capsular biosynthesis protein n=1 Tax=Thalassotalea piscium TaxID=1230533 RepID=A0A7X0NG06_9GAMM|nr:putative capsular polysaccharide synthesis family protein [Thalassotalea piscium]MBB6542755.1 hypothetical protein [Thalassotalea piscium]
MNIVKKIKAYFSAKQALVAKYADPDTIFIYQMGKVGSTSLEHSIPGAIHIHAFYLKNHTCPVRVKGLAKFGWRYFIYSIEQAFFSALLRWTFKKRKHTKIITLVREPRSRNLSMFFHDLDAYLFAAHTNCLSTRNKPLSTRVQSKDLIEQVYNEEFDHLYALNWFEKEFKPMTGIDIYSTAFDKDLGYSQISNGNISVLCVRTDRLDSSVEIIEKFIGKQLIMVNSNSAETKWYSDLYQHFALSYKLPETIEKKIITSKFYQHFFN